MGHITTRRKGRVDAFANGISGHERWPDIPTPSAPNTPTEIFIPYNLTREEIIAIKRQEVEQRYKAKSRGATGGRAFDPRAILLRELLTLMRARYGAERFPDTEIGRHATFIAAHTLFGLKGAPERLLALFRDRAPWMPASEVKAIVRDLGKTQGRRFRAETIGKRLEVTQAERAALGLTQMRAIDAADPTAPASIRVRNGRNQTDKRRKAGAIPREQYVAQALTASKPWASLGISRRTWERRRAKAGAVASVSPAYKGALYGGDRPATPGLFDTLSELGRAMPAFHVHLKKLKRLRVAQSFRPVGQPRRLGEVATAVLLRQVGFSREAFRERLQRGTV